MREGIFHASAREPLSHRFFSVGLFKTAHCSYMATLQRMFQQTLHALELVRSFGPRAVAQAQLLELEQILAQLGSGTLGGRTRIVKLMHQPGRKGAERNQLLPMQSLHLVCLQTLRHVGQDDLAHRWAAASNAQNCSIVKRTSRLSCAAVTRKMDLRLAR